MSLFGNRDRLNSDLEQEIVAGVPACTGLDGFCIIPSWILFAFVL